MNGVLKREYPQLIHPMNNSLLTPSHGLTKGSDFEKEITITFSTRFNIVNRL